MIFLSSLQNLASLTILCVIGYVIAWKGWVSRETEMFIPKLITVVAIPPFLMGNVAKYFQRGDLLQLLLSSTVPFFSIFVSFVLFLGLAWLLRVDKRHTRLFAVASSTSNVILIGIPVSTALFGQSAIPHVLLYFLGNSVFFWTIGNYCIACEGANPSQRITVKETLRRIFSPPLCGLLAGMIIVLFHIPLPSAIADTCQYLGHLATPLAMIYVGIVVKSMNWSKEHFNKDIVFALILRLIACPLVMIAFFAFVPLPSLQKHVYIIMAGLPTMTNIALLSAYYRADKEFGSAFTTLSAIIAMFTIPVWMALNAHFFH